MFPLQKELMQNLLEHDIEVSALSGDIASWIGIDSWGEWFVLLLLKDEGLDFSEPLTEKVTLLPVQPHGVPTLCMFAKEEIDLRQCLRFDGNLPQGKRCGLLRGKCPLSMREQIPPGIPFTMSTK